MKAIILLLTIHLFQSCAPSPETPTSVKVSFGAATVDFPGGVYVIGKHRQTGAKFSHEIASGQIDLNLINGTWDFVAVGWEGGSNFTGNIKCGKSLGTGLNGTPVEVNLTLESGECMGVAGSVNPANNEPLPYKVHSCGIFARRKQFTSPDADLVQLCDEVEGNHKSFKLVWYSFNESRFPFGSKYASRKTACVNTTNGIATFTEKLPLMSNSWGLPVTIEGYKQTSCTGTMEEIHFPNGLMSQTVKGATSPDGTNIHAMVSDNVCVGDELTNNITYANGLAAGGSPVAKTLALICNKHQFAMMVNNAVHNLRFILGADIDLSGVALFDIGTDTDPFTGDFNGLGFKVKNYSNTEIIANSRGIFN